MHNKRCGLLLHIQHSLSVLVTSMSPAKKDELIEMLFGVWACGDLITRRGSLRGVILGHDLPEVNILDFIHRGAGSSDAASGYQCCRNLS